MNKYKKIVSGLLLSSLFIGNFSFSYAQADITSTPTAEEKIKVETEILKLQTNIFNNSKTYIEKLTSDFKKIASYEESGNSKIEFSMDEDMFGKAGATLNLENYVVKNKNLDSDISGNVSFSGKYIPVSGSGFEMDFSTLASMISKDGEIYAMLKDLNFKVNDENIGKVLDGLKKQFSDNKYVKLPSDDNSKMAYNLIKNFSLENSLSQGKEILSKPLLQTYKKSGNKYLLVPTKYACDTYFELDKKLNFSNAWYTPKTCTESVYKSFIKEFTSTGDFYVILGDNEKIFGIDIKKDNEILKATLNYGGDSINKIDLIISGNGDLFTINYFKNKYLNSKYYSEKGKYKMNFTSSLDDKNNFVEINSNINFNGDFVGNFVLKNQEIIGVYTIKERGYDYSSTNFDYKLKNVYGIKVTGNMKGDNTLEKLNVKFAGVDIKNKKAFLTGKTSYENGNFAVDISAKDDYSAFDFNGTGYISPKIFKLNSTYNSMGMYSGKLDILVDQSEDKNNAKFDFNVNNGTKDIVKFNMINDAKRIYKDDVKIEVPKDFKELDTKALSEALYGSYLKDARDTKRISDLHSIQAGLEIYFVDNGEYPSTLKELVSGYIAYLPKDELEGQYQGDCRFGYSYSLTTNPNNNTSYYSLYTCVESDKYKEMAKNDGGIFNNMYEIFSK